MKLISQLAWVYLLIVLAALNGCSDSESKSKVQSNGGTSGQNVLQEQNRINNEMIARYRRALELNPNDAEAHYVLALAYYAKGALDDAIAGFQAALRLDSNNADVHYNLACVYSLKSEKSQAIEHLGEAVRLNPDYIRGAQMDPDLFNVRDSEGFQTLVEE